MEEIIKTAKQIIKSGMIKDEGSGYFKIEEDLIHFTKKSGRTILECSCKNCTMFCNEKDKICANKVAVLIYLAQDPRIKKLSRELKETAEQSKNIGANIEPEYLNCLADDILSFI
jgi:hypothetical protein